MSNNRTFTMIKPDAVEKNYIGAIIEKINAAGFQIKAMKYTRLSKSAAADFYAVHKERPFYGELVDYMSSGPIRKLYATSISANAIHGSDSDENAAIEGSFFFSGLEQF